MTPAELDDRNVVLFPERIGGRFAALRRPLQLARPDWGTDQPSIGISYSDDLNQWSSPELVIRPEQPWEGTRIGAAATPIRTDKSWLLLYHRVQEQEPRSRTVVYRVGALLHWGHAVRVLWRV